MSWLLAILVPLWFAPGDGPGDTIDQPRAPQSVEREEEPPPPTLAADLHVESRARPPTDPRAREDAAIGEMFVAPGVTGLLMPGDWRLHLRYAPAFTFTSIDPLDDPFILHRGSASASWTPNQHWRFSISEWGMIGDQNFAVPEGIEIGGRYQLDFLPEANVVRLPFVSSATVLGAAWRPTGRQEYRLLADYTIYGGKDEDAQDVIPLQRGPRAIAEGLWDVSRIDVLSTRLIGTDLQFSNGRAYQIGELHLAWTRLWARTTEVRGGLGAYAANNLNPLGGDDFHSLLLPIAYSTLEREVHFGQTHGELEAGIQARPFINQLDATLEPRVVADVKFEWRWRDYFYGEARLEHAWAFDRVLRHDGRILGMGLMLGIEPWRGVRIEGGGRGYEQTFMPIPGGRTFVGTRWDVFASITTIVPIVR